MTKEEYGKELTELAAEGSLDVVDGTAGDRAVFADFLILLCQNSLTVDGGHTEEGRDPHPEQRARTADGKNDIFGNHCLKL